MGTIELSPEQQVTLSKTLTLIPWEEERSALAAIKDVVTGANILRRKFDTTVEVTFTPDGIFQTNQIAQGSPAFARFNMTPALTNLSPKDMADAFAQAPTKRPKDIELAGVRGKPDKIAFRPEKSDVLMEALSILGQSELLLMDEDPEKASEELFEFGALIERGLETGNNRRDALRRFADVTRTAMYIKERGINVVSVALAFDQRKLAMEALEAEKVKPPQRDPAKDQTLFDDYVPLHKRFDPKATKHAAQRHGVADEETSSVLSSRSRWTNPGQMLISFSGT